MVKKAKETIIEVEPIKMETMRVCIVGTTPMIMHRFSKKAREELLFPKGRANSAEKAEKLKHDPVSEFRESIYMNRDTKRPSAVHIPDGTFQKALASAALDLPGASKAQILRLVSVQRQIDMFGVPTLGMDMVRSSGMDRTPDVRTRAYFAEWACRLEIDYVSSLLKQNQIVNLLAAAGMIVGVGDWRPQKGGSFGKFSIVSENHSEFQRIVKTGGRVAQLEAINNPVTYDAEAEELLTWFHAEAEKREKNVPSATVSDKDVVASVQVAAKAAGKGKRNGRAAH